MVPDRTDHAEDVSTGFALVGAHLPPGGMRRRVAEQAVKEHLDGDAARQD
jgi:hypothetical protein